MQLNETRWGNWLRDTTGGSSSREIAERIGRLQEHPTGVSHTTVQRWSRTGIPPAVVFELALRYQVDICAAVIQQGWVSIDEVRSANMGFLVQQIPTEKLTEELHRRALEGRAPKHDVGVPAVKTPLTRSDAITRQSFRLTSKN